MKKLIPKYQSPWTPIGYQTPENSEPRSAKPKAKHISVGDSSVSNIPIQHNIHNVDDNLTEQQRGLQAKRAIEKADKPVSGTDPIGQFWVEGEMIGRPLMWAVKPVIKAVSPYVSRAVQPLISKGRNWINSNIFSNKVTRVVGNDGNIYLRLGNHSKGSPRQLTIEPQNNNQFRVHANTWGGVTNAQKKQLYEAFYNEIPEGGEILFPESSMDYLGTRGTVAGLKRLGRDARWTPSGTTQKLLYRDKDGTIKTFEGTGFIKRNQNSPAIGGYNKSDETFRQAIKNLQSQYPNMKLESAEWMPNSTIDMFATSSEFTPVYVVQPGKVNSEYMTKEYLDRLSKAGYKLFNPIPMNDRGFTIVQSPYKTIINNNKKHSLLGFFKNKSYGGMYSNAYDVSAVSPEVKMPVPSILFHERNMHGTDKVITALNAWKPYQDFLNKLYYDEAIVDGKVYQFPFNTEGLNLLKESANKEELRATVGELVRKLHASINKAYGTNMGTNNPVNVREMFNNAVDKMDENVLLNQLGEVNGYGADYVKLSKNSPTFIKDLKELIKYGYGAIPVALTIKKASNSQ